MNLPSYLVLGTILLGLHEATSQIPFQFPLTPGFSFGDQDPGWRNGPMDPHSGPGNYPQQPLAFGPQSPQGYNPQTWNFPGQLPPGQPPPGQSPPWGHEPQPFPQFGQVQRPPPHQPYQQEPGSYNGRYDLGSEPQFPPQRFLPHQPDHFSPPFPQPSFGEFPFQQSRRPYSYQPNISPSRSQSFQPGPAPANGQLPPGPGMVVRPSPQHQFDGGPMQFQRPPPQGFFPFHDLSNQPPSRQFGSPWPLFPNPDQGIQDRNHPLYGQGQNPANYPGTHNPHFPGGGDGRQLGNTGNGNFNPYQNPNGQPNRGIGFPNNQMPGHNFGRPYGLDTGFPINNPQRRPFSGANFGNEFNFPQMKPQSVSPSFPSPSLPSPSLGQNVGSKGNDHLEHHPSPNPLDHSLDYPYEAGETDGPNGLPQAMGGSQGGSNADVSAMSSPNSLGRNQGFGQGASMKDNDKGQQSGQVNGLENIPGPQQKDGKVAGPQNKGGNLQGEQGNSSPNGQGPPPGLPQMNLQDMSNGQPSDPQKQDQQNPGGNSQMDNQDHEQSQGNNNLRNGPQVRHPGHSPNREHFEDEFAKLWRKIKDFRKESLQHPRPHHEQQHPDMPLELKKWTTHVKPHYSDDPHGNGPPQKGPGPFPSGSFSPGGMMGKLPPQNSPPSGLQNMAGQFYSNGLSPGGPLSGSAGTHPGAFHGPPPGMLNGGPPPGMSNGGPPPGSPNGGPPGGSQNGNLLGPPQGNPNGPPPGTFPNNLPPGHPLNDPNHPANKGMTPGNMGNLHPRASHGKDGKAKHYKHGKNPISVTSGLPNVPPGDDNDPASPHEDPSSLPK